MQRFNTNKIHKHVCQEEEEEKTSVPFMSDFVVGNLRVFFVAISVLIVQYSVTDLQKFLALNNLQSLFFFFLFRHV